MSIKNPAVLTCHRLSVSFSQPKGFLQTLKDIHLELYKGQTVGLVGESGSGKSMTALSILRLLPHHAYYGRYSKIIYQKKDILNLEYFRMRDIRGQKIAMVFQEPMMALNPVKTFYTHMKDVILAHQPMKKMALHQKIMQLMQDVELDVTLDKLQQYPHQWSGGQKQRFLIAMALSNNPDILLADEPTTALDVAIQKQILCLLKKLQNQYGLALLLISHDFNVVRAVSDHIVVMYAGQVIEYGPADSFWQKSRHPYVHSLLNCAPSFEKRKQILSVIPGMVPNFYEEPSGCRFHPRCHFATKKCQNQMPQWYKIESQHAVRCHLYPRSMPFEIQTEQEVHLDYQVFGLNKCLLKVSHLSVKEQKSRHWYQKKQVEWILQDIHLSLYKGKTLAIVGESGSGKTTLVRSILGLHPMTSGHIEWAPDLKRSDIQYIFQDSSAAMNPRWNMRQIVSEGHPHHTEHDLFWILDAVQMHKRCLSLYPHELSGGQRQRIAIARSLLANPKILICDEPTSALDISVQAQILNLLKNIQSEFGLSYILITHDLDVVGYMADDVCVLKEGRIVENGHVEQVLKTPSHEYTQYLLQARGFLHQQLIDVNKGE